MKYKDYKDRKRFADSQVVPLLIEAGFEKRAKRIASCGHFKKVAVCQECGTWHFNGADCCRDRFCPVCQKKRSLLWFAKITPLLKEYIEQGYYINFINFTIRDTASLSYGVNLMQDAFRYLTNLNKTTAKEFNRRFIGGVRSLENIKGKNSGLWHPHYHCLAVKYKFEADFEWLSKEWNNALCVVSGKYGQKLGSVYLKGFKKTKEQGLEEAICECFKYITKFNWKAVDVKELVNVMNNRKSIFTWGCIRHKLQKYDVESEMDLSLTQIKNRICSVCGNDSFDLIDNVAGDHMRLADFIDLEKNANAVFNVCEERW